jgi:Zn-dependent protease
MGEIYLGKIIGIPFRLHWSWFLVVALIAYQIPEFLGLGLLPTSWRYWSLGLAAALGLFGSVLLHELGHAVVAKAYRIPVRGIRLFFFGGVAELAGEPKRPSHEILMALGGPFVSVLLVFLFGALWFATAWGAGLSPADVDVLDPALDGWWPTALARLLRYLSLANLGLLIFNMVPAFPLDGGRVFRAILWAATDSYLRGTRIAGIIGIGFAWLLMIGGLLLVLGHAYQGLWFILLGMFLYNAAQSSMAYAQLQHSLAGLRVRDLMQTQPVAIPDHLTLSDVLEHYFLRHPHKAYPVVRDGEVVGMLSLRMMQQVERQAWPTLRAGELFDHRPAVTLHPNEPLLSALQKMAEESQSRLPVVADGRLVGVLARRDILDALEIRTGLGNEASNA